MIEVYFWYSLQENCDNVSSARHINITFKISECRLGLYYRATKEGVLFWPVSVERCTCIQGVEMQFRIVCAALGALALSAASFQDASAARRFERSTPAARESQLAAEYAAKGLKLGSPIFIRVYKQSSTMELWVAQGARYVPVSYTHLTLPTTPYV